MTESDSVSSAWSSCWISNSRIRCCSRSISSTSRGSRFATGPSGAPTRRILRGRPLPGMIVSVLKLIPLDRDLEEEEHNNRENKGKTGDQLDLNLAVHKFHVLSSKELGNLIRDAENDTIKWTDQNGLSFEINVENLARYLGTHIMEHLSSFEQDEEHLRYLLSGLRLLHILYDIASHHSKLEEVLVEDVNVGTKLLDLIFSMVIFLSHLEEETIDGSIQMVLLYSALLASSLYLLRALVSPEWQTVTLLLLAHPKVDEFTIAALTAVCVIINILQSKLPAQHVDSHMKSKVNDACCVFQLCEASLQFLQSLCKQMLFREHLVKNKELCREGVVLKLVKNTMKLPQCEDPHLMDVVYRLKSKVLSIMLLLCEVESPSFLAMSFSTTQSLELAESTVFEVLEVLKMMFFGDVEDHPKGILQLYAMQLTEILSCYSSFKTYIVLNLTEVLAHVFSQPQREFLNTWCSNDLEPAEEDIVMEFDPISSAGQVLGFISTSQVQPSTWSNFQAPQTPYAHQKSSLLGKILANLTSFVPGLCEDEKALYIKEFLECLQKEFSKLPGGADERIAAASQNLYQCPSSAPKTSSPNEHDDSGIDNECEPISLAMIQLHQLTFMESGQNQSNDDDNVGGQNIETFNRIKDLEMFKSEEEIQQKKRKRTKMNDMQIEIMENALLDHPDLQKRAGSLQLWADKLSGYGSEVTRSQLRNWLNNRKAKLARAAAKDAHAHFVWDDVLIEKQTGSWLDCLDPIFESSHEIHQRNLRESVLKICDTQLDTVVVPTYRFKHEVGQYVMLTNYNGEEIGTGIIHLARGVWFGRYLEELRLCVVDVDDIRVPKWTQLPHPTDAGTTFCQAEMILGRIRILWNSSQLLLIPPADAYI
ncbi:hypothetical protein E3N88_46252 [Mikania micrantha]|uniref:Homeobox domain-containing protein n=1 Tax=Mikania micrantha TaxID=192012 RepID=A0A5N6L969_9ASTR|nr:hypothetical protein E3N88_46252 [Mikania micrantha]